MWRLLFDSSVRVRYLIFLIDGLAQGALAFLMLLLLIGRHPTADLRLLIICLLSGVTLSAVVFGLMLKTPHWFQSVGFLIVGALIPYLALVTSTSLTYQRLNLLPEPLALMIVFLWTAFVLPFAGLAAVIYFSTWLMFKRKQNREEPLRTQMHRLTE